MQPLTLTISPRIEFHQASGTKVIQKSKEFWTMNAAKTPRTQESVPLHSWRRVPVGFLGPQVLDSGSQIGHLSSNDLPDCGNWKSKPFSTRTLLLHNLLVLVGASFSVVASLQDFPSLPCFSVSYILHSHLYRTLAVRMPGWQPQLQGLLRNQNMLVAFKHTC